MLLRDYAAGDFARLCALDQQCFEPGIAYSKSELRGFIESPATFTVVATDDLQPTGILGFAIVRNIRVAGAAALHIITIDVGPEARRQGVGRRMVQWMEDRARALGSRSMRLEVCETNLAAQKFYEHAGFKVTSRIPAYYGPSLDALVMERPLD